MSRRLKFRSRFRDPTSRDESSKISSFDPVSGLGFMETVYQGGPMTADWVWWAPGNASTCLNRNSGFGTSGLRKTAIRAVSANASSLTPEVLESVPWLVAKDVWRDIKAK